jgi:NTE family protein
MRASYALPGIFKPVLIDGRWLFDGALVNPIPVSVCRALGARYVIAVNVNTDSCGRGTVVAHMEALPPPTPAPEAEPSTEEGLLARNRRAVKKLLQRQFFGRADNGPGISRVMMEAFNIVQDRIARSRLAGDPPDAVISPRLPAFGVFDFHRAEAMIECGFAAATREIDDIKREIASRRIGGPVLARSA